MSNDKDEPSYPTHNDVRYLSEKIRQILKNWEFLRGKSIEDNDPSSASYENCRDKFKQIKKKSNYKYNHVLSGSELKEVQDELIPLRDELMAAMEIEALKLIKKIELDLKNTPLEPERKNEIMMYLDNIRSVNLRGEIKLKSPRIENAIMDLYRMKSELVQANIKSSGAPKTEESSQKSAKEYIANINKIVKLIGSTEEIPDIIIRYEAAKKDSNPSLANLKQISVELHDFVVARAKGTDHVDALKKRWQQEGKQRHSMINELKEGTEAILKVYKSPFKPAGVR